MTITEHTPIVSHGRGGMYEQARDILCSFYLEKVETEEKTCRPGQHSTG